MRESQQVEAEEEAQPVGEGSPESGGHLAQRQLGEGVGQRSLVERATEPYRAISRFVGRHAATRAVRAIPRTLGFMGSAIVRGEVADTVPAPHLSLGLAAQVAMDEALLAIAMTPNRFPLRSDFERVAVELAAARSMYVRRGWIAHPASYHRQPPALVAGAPDIGRGWADGIAYERLSFPSEFVPRHGEPGSERWASFGPNHTASAAVVRHSGGPRPWVIALHGFCTGYPFMDFVGLQTARLHRELGLNVALPVLPLHGSRKVTLVSGEPFLSFDLMNAVHGLTQAVWDVRRLISWIRDQGATSIGLYGVSLGGYIAALMAGLEPGIDVVVAGIPVSDFPGLFHQHSPHHLRARSIEHRIMGGAAEDVFTVVSPLSFAPLVPHDRRFVFAGYGDRLATPAQAQRLWEHWDQPSINWYAGNHVGYLWSRQVADFLCQSLGASGLSCRTPAAGN